MKKFILFLFKKNSNKNILYAFFVVTSFFISNQTIKAQLSSEWAVKFGGTLSEYSTSMKLDPSGNIIIVGYFSGTVDFDPGLGTDLLSSVGSIDAFVCKLDPQGNLIWAKSFGSIGEDRAQGMSIDANGNIYICGFFTNSADFDPHPTNDYTLVSSGNKDIFILKLDSNGNFIWANSFGNSEIDIANDIQVTASGTIYVTGHFDLTVDFDPSPTVSNLISSNNSDFFLAKYDSNGNYIWAKDTEGFALVKGTSLVVDDFENIYSIGFFNGNVDFDWNTTTSLHSTFSYAATFILKHDMNGTLRWSKIFENGYRENYDITVDGLGNVIAGGRFSIQTDLDPGPGTSLVNSSGGEDLFIVKLNPLGVFVWGITLGGDYTNSDKIFAIKTDATNNILFTGSFEGTIDMDPGITINNHTSNGYSDVYITKLDESGNFIWSETFGGSGVDNGIDLIIDNTGNIYSTGFFSESVDFDPGTPINALSVTGARDFFVNKLIAPTHIIDNNNEISISVFPNPASDFITIHLSEKATISIHDLSGRLLFQSERQENELHVDLIAFSSGFVMVRLETESGIYTRPVVIY